MAVWPNTHSPSFFRRHVRKVMRASIVRACELVNTALDSDGQAGYRLPTTWTDDQIDLYASGSTHDQRTHIRIVSPGGQERLQGLGRVGEGAIQLNVFAIVALKDVTITDDDESCEAVATGVSEDIGFAILGILAADEPLAGDDIVTGVYGVSTSIAVQKNQSVQRVTNGGEIVTISRLISVVFTQEGPFGVDV